MRAIETTEGSDRAFAFLELNQRPEKPRSRGVTEIRGPYYTPIGRRYLKDVLETMGAYVGHPQVRRRFVRPDAARVGTRR